MFVVYKYNYIIYFYCFYSVKNVGLDRGNYEDIVDNTVHLQNFCENGNVST